MAWPQLLPKTSTDDLDVEISPGTSRVDSAAHAAHQTQLRNRFEYDLTKVEDARSYLEKHVSVYKNFELQPLAGGTANHVYRLTEQGEGREGKTSIFKHAARQLASDPSFALDPERMDFEAKILYRLTHEAECQCNLAKDFQTSVIEKTHVHAVALGSYERDIKLLCIQDAGNRNLKDAYAELSRDEIQEIGTELGKWLAKLHGKTPKAHVTEPGYHNNGVGVNIARYTYKNLSAALKGFGHNEQLAEDINEYFGDLIAKDNECVCHGDFWPGNVMLQSSVPEGGSYLLTVIDWELVRIGNSATDLGQFAAEAFLLDRFHGDKGLHAAFIRAYFKSSAVNFGSKEMLYPWMTRIAIHFAVHIAFWPTRSVHWANRENTKALVDLAVAILEDAISSTPDARVWRVFEGLQNIDEIAREMMVKRGEPWARRTSNGPPAL